MSGGPKQPARPDAQGIASTREHEALTIFERSREGRRAFTAPEAGVPEVPVDELLPTSQIRERPAALPEISEPELVRHYVTLSSKNFHLDEGF
jgi:glycine dehydrogenase subunit 2